MSEAETTPGLEEQFEGAVTDILKALKVKVGDSQPKRPRNGFEYVTVKTHPDDPSASLRLDVNGLWSFKLSTSTFPIGKNTLIPNPLVGYVLAGIHLPVTDLFDRMDEIAAMTDRSKEAILPHFIKDLRNLHENVRSA